MWLAWSPTQTKAEEIKGREETSLALFEFCLWSILQFMCFAGTRYATNMTNNERDSNYTTKVLHLTYDT